MNRTYTATLADRPRRLQPSKMGNPRYSFKFVDPVFPKRVRTRENSGGILAHDWSMLGEGDVVRFTLSTAGTIMQMELVERA